MNGKGRIRVKNSYKGILHNSVILDRKNYFVLPIEPSWKELQDGAK